MLSYNHLSMRRGSSLPPHRSYLALLLLGLASQAIAGPSPLLHGPDDSLQPVFSPDGSRLAFASTLTNLVTNDTNGRALDVFLLDLSSGRTDLVSVRADGTGSGDGQSYAPQFTAGGTAVLFESRAENLVTNDANGRADIFLRYLDSGQTHLLSTNRIGVGANGNSFHPRASANGRRIAFQSQATDLTSTFDGNGRDDVFLLERDAGTTTIISTNRFRQPATNGAAEPFISADGGFVAFQSASLDLVQSPGSGYVTELYLRRTDSGRIDMLRAITNGTRRTVPVLNPMMATASNELACILNGQAAWGTPVGTFRFDLQTGVSLNQGIGSSTNLTGFRISNLAGPAMSADGSVIAVEGLTGTGTAVRRGVFLWRPGSIDPEELVSDALPRDSANFLHSPVLAANGSRVAALHSSGVLVVFNADGTIAGGPFSADDWSAPALSNDGRLVAFHTLLPNAPGQPATQALFLIDLAAAVRLDIRSTANGVEISWTPLGGYNLEAADVLGGGWQPVDGATGSTVELPLTGGGRFFRLHKP
jgi:hypothetical protein